MSLLHGLLEPPIHGRIRMRKIWLPVALLLIAVALQDLYAGWTCRSDVSVPVTVQQGNQWNVQLVSDGNGGSIMVWQDRREGFTDKLYMQRVDGSGEVLWQQDGAPIAHTQPGFQYYPQLLEDGIGGAFVVWQDNRSGTDYDIFIQHVSSDGQVLWGTNGIAVCNASGHQYNPQVSTDGKGGIFVVWQDRRSGNFDIYAQRYSSTGGRLWTNNGVAVSTVTFDQVNPKVIFDDREGLITVWTDFRRGNGFSDVYAQLIQRDGRPGWSIGGVPVCVESNAQWNPQIVVNGGNGAVISWQDRRSGTVDQIYGQRIDANGTARWALNGVQLSSSSGIQYNQRMVSDGEGGAVVVWQDNRSGLDYDIFTQRVSDDGRILWTGSGRAVSTASGHQYNPQVIQSGVNFLITWQDKRGGSDFDIYAQRVMDDGQMQWSRNGEAVLESAGDQIFPQLATDGAQGAVIAWTDFQGMTGFTDVYAHRIAADGRLAGGCYRTFTQEHFSQKAERFRNRLKGVYARPNVGNVRDSIFRRGYFPNGLVVGVPRRDSIRAFGWETFSRSVHIRNALPQSGRSRPFDYFLSRNFYNALRNPSTARYNNRLSGELITLKLNIAASDLGMTEENLGDLVFDDRENPDNPLNRRSLRSVASFVDTLMTMWKSYPATDYEAIDLALRNINNAFAGAFDTVSTSPIRVSSVRPLALVPFLVSSPETPPLVVLPVAGASFDEEDLPEKFALSQNYPNPFNPYTTIEFYLPEPAIVSIQVYDILGREVAVLMDRSLMDEGDQVADFDGTELSSGIYIYRLSAQSISDPGATVSLTNKMALVK